MRLRLNPTFERQRRVRTMEKWKMQSVGRRALTALLLLAPLFATQLAAQTVPALTVQEVLARNINGTQAQQMRPIPHKIIGNLYYVGSETLSSFLVVTPQGHILINSNFERNVPLIKASVEKLGFSFKDIKILKIGRASCRKRE